MISPNKEWIATKAYVGPINDVVDLEIEDFAFSLFNEIVGKETLGRDEFHEVYFLHGGWADPRDYFLEIFEACGLEWRV